MHAFLFLAGKRRQREDKIALALHALAAQGDQAAINRAIKDTDD